MKLAKKVLSVVLALVLALSAFAVVGSANGNPDADYQVKIWLTGTVGEVNWTSATRVSMTETGDESDPGATIEVQPGEEVFVRFYLTNNYYVHTFQTNVFFSSGLLDAAQLYVEQTGKDCSSARLAKMLLWNEDEHYWTGAQGTGVATANVFSLMTPTFQTNTKQNWPTDDEGNVLLNMDDWKFAIFNNLTQEKSGETCIWEEEVWIFSMPVSVPADAQPGDTFYVTIPEGLEQRDAKPNGALRLSEIGIAEGESEPCDIVDAQALLYPNMSWGNENQYYDLSEATLTLQVPGSSEPELNFDELNAKLDEAADLLAGGNLTAASIAGLNAAIEAGNAALSATSQDDIDAAVTVLADAINAAEGLASYTALNEAMARYEALNPADWSNFADATAAYDVAAAIEEGLGVSAQGTIDAAAADLNAAIDALAPALNYADLEAAYNALADKDVANYTDDTVARFNAALAAAKALIDNQNAADQNEIDAAAAELDAADKALAEKDANYTALDAAIKAFEEVNAKAWTTDSYEAAKAKYDEAKAVARDLKISAQATIDAAAEALDAAIKALVPAAGANYTALDEAIEAAEALVAENYVDFSAVNTALAAAKAVARDLTANDQAIIDDATAALVAAMGALTEADADYTAVTAAQSAAQAILDKKDNGVNSYSDATLEAINAALATVETGLKKKDQAKVDEMAAAINAAVATAEFRAWDYTAINDHIATIEANPADYYDAGEYADYLAAKEALVWDYTYETYAKAKLQEINFLKVTVAAAAAADYTAVNDAIAAFNAKIDAADYEQDGIDAVNAIIDSIDWNLNVNSQAIVDKYAADISAATDALVEVVVELVNYDRLDAAIAAAKAVDADLYTGDSYYEVNAALYTAESISRELTVDQQEFVDEVAKTLEDAIAALELKADYSALDAAIADAATYDKNAWTDATWAVVEEKLAAANEVDRELGETSQAIIDEATEALVAALGALEAKEVTSSVKEITYTPSEDTHNTFEVKVDGRMAMVQFIEEDGGTRTYDRYNKNVTIKSYNADGEEVNSLDRSVAYEVWTINTNLIGPNVQVRTKYLDGNKYVWETEKYSFTLEFVEPTFDADIREITPSATSGKKGAVATTVVVGPEAQGVRFVMANGTTTTYYAEKATVLENGDLSFTGNAWANDAGVNTIIVKVRVNGAWVEMGSFDYTVE